MFYRVLFSIFLFSSLFLGCVPKDMTTTSTTSTKISYSSFDESRMFEDCYQLQPVDAAEFYGEQMVLANDKILELQKKSPRDEAMILSWELFFYQANECREKNLMLKDGISDEVVQEEDTVTEDPNIVMDVWVCEIQKSCLGKIKHRVKGLVVEPYEYPEGWKLVHIPPDGETCSVLRLSVHGVYVGPPMKDPNSHYVVTYDPLTKEYSIIKMLDHVNCDGNTT